MSNRELSKVCSGLSQVGVEVKPEEAQNPTRLIASRVMLDFAVQAFMINPDLLHQPLSMNLENSNPHSSVPSWGINRVILTREALRLLNRGGSQFTMDVVLKPEAKKFNLMLNIMLKYFFHTERSCDLVTEGSANLEEAAARIERQRGELDFVKNELSFIEERIQTLHRADVPKALAQVTERRDALTQEADQINTDYIELKSFVEKSKEEVSSLMESLKRHEAELNELRELVVEDPESCVKELDELKKEVARKREDLINHEKTLATITTEMRTQADIRVEMKAAKEMAECLRSAVEELEMLRKNSESRLTEKKRKQANLESEESSLRSSIESRNRQIATISEREQSIQKDSEALEVEETAKRDLLSKKEKSKEPLKNAKKQLQQKVESEVSMNARFEEESLRMANDKNVQNKKVWNDHLEVCKLFEEECELTREELSSQRAIKEQVLKKLEVFIDRVD